MTATALSAAFAAALCAADPAAAAGARAPEAERPEEMTPVLASVLTRVVGPGGEVRWKVLRAAPDDLRRYVGWLARVSPATHPAYFPRRDAKLSYWINAYNALVLSGVLAHYPCGSVMAIQGGAFFKDKTRAVGGRNMSLDAIETKVREDFADPRVHYALNCASRSCPPHWREPAEPRSVQRQLAAAAERTLASPRFVEIDGAEGVVKLNRIFEWYAPDFVRAARAPNGKKATVVDYLRGHVSDLYRTLLESRARWRVVYMEYDWSLNEARTE